MERLKAPRAKRNLQASELGEIGERSRRVLLATVNAPGRIS
jgi:hypothetical protein